MHIAFALAFKRDSVKRSGCLHLSQVTLEAKVRTCSSVGEGLADEAALVEANLLVLRRSGILLNCSVSFLSASNDSNAFFSCVE